MATTVRKGSARPGAKKAIDTRAGRAARKAAKKVAAKKATARKATKKPAAKKTVAAKKAATKRASTRKTAAKKAATKKAATKKAAGRKTTAKKATPRKATARKTPAKKATAQKTATKKAAARKAPARKAPARKAAARKSPRAARGITPAQALANTRRLLEAKKAHDRETPPWQALEGHHASAAHPGFQDAQARDQANELHAAESDLDAIHGASGSQDRHNQGRRDQR